MQYDNKPLAASRHDLREATKRIQNGKIHSYEAIGEITEAARAVMKSLELFIGQMELLVCADPDQHWGDDADDAPPYGYPRPCILTDEEYLHRARVREQHNLHRSIVVSVLGSWGMRLLNDADDTMQAMKMLAIRVQDNNKEVI